MFASLEWTLIVLARLLSLKFTFPLMPIVVLALPVMSVEMLPLALVSVVVPALTRNVDIAAIITWRDDHRRRRNIILIIARPGTAQIPAVNIAAIAVPLHITPAAWTAMHIDRFPLRNDHDHPVPIPRSLAHVHVSRRDGIPSRLRGGSCHKKYDARSDEFDNVFHDTSPRFQQRWHTVGEAP